MRDFHTVGSWTLADHLASAAQARACMRGAAAAHPSLDDLELVASELVANAVEHGGGPIELALDEAPGRLRITVSSDAGSAEPEVVSAAMDAGSGRGLALVSSLAERWGWERVDGRLAVWAEFSDA